MLTLFSISDLEEGHVTLQMAVDGKALSTAEAPTQGVN